MNNDNYLHRVPFYSTCVDWKFDGENVVLEKENRGFCNRIAQLMFKKPRISYIHLDNIGSIVWTLTDGKKDIAKIGDVLRDIHGIPAELMYERLCTYFASLYEYGFIKFR